MYSMITIFTVAALLLPLVPAPRTPTPVKLLAQNKEWAKKFSTEQPELLKAIAKGQTPSVYWIGCSDSRVPESVITNAFPGQIFVSRNIANTYDESEAGVNSALLYGVEVLGVEHVIIAGHTQCGGVHAACAHKVPNTAAFQRYLAPIGATCEDVATRRNLTGDPKARTQNETTDLAEAAIIENVKRQVDNVVNSKVIQANWAGRRSVIPGTPNVTVQVHGWLEIIATEEIVDLNITRTARDKKMHDIYASTKASNGTAQEHR